MNMIVGKKQIILASLVLALGIAVYLNYQFANVDGDFVLSSGQAQTTEEENYGDAKFVDKKGANDAEKLAAVNSAEYFSQAKLTRTKSRDEAVEALKVMLADKELTTEQKTTLTTQATDLAKAIEIEGKIENLIKAKGFSECMVYYDAQKVDVVLKTDGLLDNEVTQIRDIILQEANVPVQNISIVPIQ